MYIFKPSKVPGLVISNLQKGHKTCLKSLHFPGNGISAMICFVHIKSAGEFQRYTDIIIEYINSNK